MELDYSEIQRALDKLESGGRQMDFSALVGKILADEDALSAKGLVGLFLDNFKISLSDYRELFLQISGIAVGAALLKLLTDSFKNRQVGETGFFISFLLLFALLLSGYRISYGIAESTMNGVTEFMQCLIPTYFISIAFCSGSAVSLAYYQVILLAIHLVEVVLVKFLLPLVGVYFVLVLVDRFVKEDSLGQMADLCKKVVEWGGKTLFGLIIGIETVQGMILPVSGKLKQTALFKTAGMLPAVGNLVSGTAETVLETGILLKNAVGTAGLLILLLLCALPFAELVCHYFVYKFAAGILQPISDKRITGSLAAAAEALRLLLYLAGITVLLFALSISLIAASTNLG